MKRIIRSVLLVGIIGLVAGYFIFAKSGGHYINVMRLVLPSRNILQGIGNAVQGVENMRLNILLCGAAGALVGLGMGIAPRVITRKLRRK